jgi:hypothetical protein
MKPAIAFRYKVGEQWKKHESSEPWTIIFIPEEQDYVVARMDIGPYAFGRVYAFHVDHNGYANCGTPRLCVKIGGDDE